MMDLNIPTRKKDLVDLFNEYLDDTQKPIEVCGYEYLPSSVLSKTDPIVYKEMFDAYCESLHEDGLITQGELDDSSLYLGY